MPNRFLSRYAKPEFQRKSFWVTNTSNTFHRVGQFGNRRKQLANTIHKYSIINVKVYNVNFPLSIKLPCLQFSTHLLQIRSGGNVIIQGDGLSRSVQ